MFHSVLSRDRSHMYLIPSSRDDSEVYTVYDDVQYRLQLSKFIHANCSNYTGPLSINIGKETLALGSDEWQDFFIEYVVLAIYKDLGLEPENIM